MGIRDHIIDITFDLNNTRSVRPDLAPACDEIFELLRPLVEYINKNGDPTIPRDLGGRELDIIDCESKKENRGKSKWIGEAFLAWLRGLLFCR